jgi:hypothetical protein
MAGRRPINLERRLAVISSVLLVSGGLASWLLFDLPRAISFLAGGVLAGVSLLWLHRAVDGMFSRDPKQSKFRMLAGFFLRLLLIPLCLYAMIRFLFLSLPAAVAGFAVFHCSVFIEGILEAFDSGPE